ncbi:putative cofD-like protein [Nonomuraea soli]|uniref:Putative gluconeogenesis factor n=1 Tax=Nonomuraea soli TaxID=1032476 RepID=A0A7W0HUB9_9ACTN|nr:putative cofD-like protein [Nonomuraea soli]
MEELDNRAAAVPPAEAVLSDAGATEQVAARPGDGGTRGRDAGAEDSGGQVAVVPSKERPGPARVSGGPRVVALGGGHGLYASLSALRAVTSELTAIVTVADDGGSSGRLRRELGVLPPGDLRMALAALCGDDEWGSTWSEVVQHRFRSEGELHGHAVGNLLIVALWELLGDPVKGLEWVGRLLGAHGRVLPMASVPLDIVAEVELDGRISTVRGQVACALTPGRVQSISLVPENPPARPEAVEAIMQADWVIFGPGSWFTSVLPHLMVPELARALHDTKARRLVTLNLAPQPGETDDFSPQQHLEVLRQHAPELPIDVVLADAQIVDDRGALDKAAATMGARLVMSDVAAQDGSARHDPRRLASVLDEIFLQKR